MNKRLKLYKKAIIQKLKDEMYLGNVPMQMAEQKSWAKFYKIQRKYLVIQV